MGFMVINILSIMYDALHQRLSRFSRFLGIVLIKFSFMSPHSIKKLDVEFGESPITYGAGFIFLSGCVYLLIDKLF